MQMLNERIYKFCVSVYGYRERMFTNMQCKEKNLWINDIEILGNHAWCISYVYNYLFCVTLDTLKIVRMIRIPIGSAYTRFAINYLLTYENKLLLVPKEGTFYLLYDIQNDFFEKKDCKTFNINRLTTACIRDKSLIGVTGKDQFIYQYDLENDVLNKYEISEKCNKLVGIRIIDNSQMIVISYDPLKFFITSYDGIVKNVIDKLPQNEKSDIVDWLPFTDMVKCNNKIYTFPRYSNMILEIDLDTNMVSEVVNTYDSYTRKNGRLFADICLDKNRIISYADYMNKWLIMDCGTKYCEIYDCKVNDEQWGLLTSDSILSECSILQEDRVGEFFLTRFLKDIVEIK